ncbi:MAG: glycosyltransferase [Terrimesophilobacter sp.]
MSLPDISFAHLRGLSDARGLFEHARGTTARRHLGYCVDDVARGLVVVSREGVELQDLTEVYLKFLVDAQVPDGRFRNRLSLSGHWSDLPGADLRNADLRSIAPTTVEDCWGRALWGLGAAVTANSVAGATGANGATALAAFTKGAFWRSPYRHSMAFAALGAAEVLSVLPGHSGARALIAAAAETIGRPRAAHLWPWPEDSLRYANAALPEALIAAGDALGDESILTDGLMLLDWLLTVETRDGHLSVTPVGGRGPGTQASGFDQQPIEAAAIASACARAFRVTGDHRFADGVDLAAAWFLGDNDGGVALYDAASGGCCDGLQQGGRNENQGAESTLAALSTLQLARRLPVMSR